jgi:hypothetical protein
MHPAGKRLGGRTQQGRVLVVIELHNVTDLVSDPLRRRFGRAFGGAWSSAIRAASLVMAFARETDPHMLPLRY